MKYHYFSSAGERLPKLIRQFPANVSLVIRRWYNGVSELGKRRIQDRIFRWRDVRFSPIDYTRIVEAAAFLVKQSPGHSTTKMPLLKLLYIADRESVRRTGQSITGDAPAAMQHGPILRCTYNMMKNPGAYSLWKEHLDSSKEKKEITLKSDPGVDHLSKLDIDILAKVWKEYGHFNFEQLKNHTHKFGEYLKNEPSGNTSNDISLADLLEALGQSDRLEKIEQETAQFRAMHNKFSEYSR